MSRDPEDGKPIDPQSLHKYLYAGGDPANRIDATGRADIITYADLSSGPFQAAKIVLAVRLACYANTLYNLIWVLLNSAVTRSLPTSAGDPAEPVAIRLACLGLSAGFPPR